MASSIDRLSQLRTEMSKLGINGFIIPRADEHQGEYVPPSAARLGWLTGFTGSAGTSIVRNDRAAVFVDGRYVIQVQQEVDGDLYERVHIADRMPNEWLKETLKEGDVIGFDPWLHTPTAIRALRTVVEGKSAKLEPVSYNPVDAIWSNQPAPPASPIVPYDTTFAGEPADEKRDRLANAMSERNVDAVVITLPDSIAWLLNIRGSDVQNCPLPLSFAILNKDGSVQLFCAPEKISDGLEAHLGNAVSISPRDGFLPALDQLGQSGATVQIDFNTAPVLVEEQLTNAGAIVVNGADPCLLPKACKNEVELNGTRKAHVRDGGAVAHFLAFMDKEAANENLTELSAAETLKQFREATGQLRDLSFDTISGVGPNAAIPHYRVTEESSLPIRKGEIYLVDSGGQYLDGTTDITRTIIVGEPTAEMKDRFTRVLKGHIALSRIRFPKGTSGAHLDALARQFLWQAGLDFDHGTGHGVGVYLNVHEGPQNISKRLLDQPLQPGMILSNEPGYYKANDYGIRIENLVVVTEPQEIEGGERPMMGFETLTFAPIDLNLVDENLLTAEEKDWLNDYHASVREKILPEIEDTEVRSWLEQATRAV